MAFGKRGIHWDGYHTMAWFACCWSIARNHFVLLEEKAASVHQRERWGKGIESFT